MATVLLAEDRVLGRQVAVKRVHAPESDMADRLVREARLGASLNHPNIVKVFDALSPDGEALIVMEYVEGQTLANALKSGPMPREQGLRVLTEMASALDYIHQNGIVHRDVKPANVLLALDGSVKLVDLGIALSEELTRITAEGTALGSVPYMAPEQLGGDEAGPATDVYALAAVAYEVLSGQRARRAGTPAEVMAQIANAPPPDLREALPEAPEQAAEVLRRAMSFEPADRPGSAGELIRQLGAAMAEPEPSPPTAEMPRTELPGAAAAAAAATNAPAPDRGAAPDADRSPARDRSAPRRAAVPARDRPAPPRRPAAAPAGAPARERSAPRRLNALLLMALGLAAALVLAVVLASSGNDDPRDERAASSPDPTATATATATAEATATEEATQEPAPDATGEPAQAVQDWYAAMASQDTDAQCALTGPSLNCRDYAFPTLRKIEFQRSDVTDASDSSATVAIQTVATHTDRTDRCSGTVTTVRDGDRWLVDGLNVSC
jgi:hypothetical protein